MKKITISCSIVLYKNDKSIQATIKCVLSSNIPVFLYLIDNSSKDNLRIDLGQFINLPNVKYIFNGKNIGFGAAHNIALKEVVKFSDYHIVLNPDVLFDENVFKDIFEYAKTDRNIGLIMPKVLNPDRTIQYLCKLLPTPSDLLIRRIPFFSKFFRQDNFELRFTCYNKIMEVPFLSGCFMFLQTECLQKVGYFDENFFMYAEDIDFCRRIHKKYKTIFYPEISVVHGYAKGSYKNIKLFIIHFISIIKYFNKWGWFVDKERETINARTLQKLLNN
ncbi:glycosyltransferase family 2 protein [Parasediminibacterium paludis]|uniref:Glycosyltransferase family 2 protein n=1 Tax=Parasediminibacterium paludis TaxID=908966 RepID=A0ABV8PZ18_9BACT